MSNVFRTITLLAAGLALYGCATSPPAQHSSSVVACRADEVRYCADHGSRASEGICTCLTQSAAKATVDSL